jgi:hypothetical protein
MMGSDALARITYLMLYRDGETSVLGRGPALPLQGGVSNAAGHGESASSVLANGESSVPSAGTTEAQCLFKLVVARALRRWSA